MWAERSLSVYGFLRECQSTAYSMIQTDADSTVADCQPAPALGRPSAHDAFLTVPCASIWADVIATSLSQILNSPHQKCNLSVAYHLSRSHLSGVVGHEDASFDIESTSAPPEGDLSGSYVCQSCSDSNGIMLCDVVPLSVGVFKPSLIHPFLVPASITVWIMLDSC